MPLLFLVALPKVLESVEEGEDNEVENSEEKMGSKPSVKEEGETSELKEETPELKVITLLLLLTNSNCALSFEKYFNGKKCSFRSVNWQTP